MRHVEKEEKENRKSRDEKFSDENRCEDQGFNLCQRFEMKSNLQFR